MARFAAASPGSGSAATTVGAAGIASDGIPVAHGTAPGARSGVGTRRWAHAFENGVNTLYGSPAPVRTVRGVDRVGRADGHQFPPTGPQRPADRRVAGDAVGRVVAA